MKKTIFFTITSIKRLRLTWNSALFLIVSAALIGIAFRQLPRLYFLNDEFLQLGSVIYNGTLIGIQKYSLVQLLVGTGRPAGTLINNIFLTFFQDNTLPFVIFAYTVHWMNTVLMFFLLYRLTKNKWIAWFGGLFFSLPAVAQQALSWFAATTQTLGGMLFILLSLHCLLYAIENRSKTLVVCSWILGFISFLFKESGFFIFPLLLFLPMLKANAVQKRPRILEGIVLSSILVFGIYKTLSFFHIQTINFTFILKNYAIQKAISNMFYYPLVSLSEVFIPFRFLLRIGPRFMLFFYPSLNGSKNIEYVGTVIGGDMIATTISLCVCMLISWIYITNKDKRKVIAYGVFAYVVSFWPAAVFLPDRNTSYVESRYFYLSLLGLSILFGITVNSIKEYFQGVLKHKVIASAIVIIALSIFLMKQISVIQREVRQNIMYGDAIRATMALLRSSVSVLPEHPVFYIDSDRDYYFTNNKLPFQLGTGYMMFLALRDRPQIPGRLVGDLWLWKYFEEGYDRDSGVGYFWNRDHLRDAVTKYNIQREQLVGIFFNSKNDTLMDISESVRSQIW